MNSIRAHKKSLLKRILACWQLYVLILPAIIAVIIFHYVPLYGLQIAFKNYRPTKGIWGSDWVGLKWFIKFFNYTDFWVIIRNTLSVSLYTLATFPCAVILALMINEVQSEKYKKYIQMVSYAPHFVSTVIVCSIVILFTQYSNGLFNNVRVLLGLDRVDIITVPGNFAHLYVWSGVWQNVGWDTIIYIAALSAVSSDLIEAAKIDGASRLQIIVHVSFPCILPTVITMLILNTGRILNVGFEKVFLLQNSLNMDRSRVLSTFVYEMGIENGQLSYASAIGMFNCVVNVIVILLVNTIAKKSSGIGLW